MSLLKHMLPAILLTGAVFAAPADTVTLSGKWQIHISIANRESDSTCTFEQMGSDLKGNCTGPNGAVDFTGKVEDKKITWGYRINSTEGGAVTLNYRGSLENPTTMTGYVNVQEYGIDGEFRGTLQK